MNVGELRTALAGLDSEASIVLTGDYGKGSITIDLESAIYEDGGRFGFPALTLKGVLGRPEIARAAEDVELLDLNHG